MAVTETVTKNVCTLKLNNGTSASGTIQTVNVGLGSLNGNPGYWDAQKALNIALLLEKCLIKTIHRVEHAATTTLSASE